MKLLDGLYAYPWTNPSANNANSYLIRSGQVVLVDPGHLEFLPRLIQALRLDGIHEDSIQRIKAELREELERRGIRGSAVEPNVEASQAWERALRELQEEFSDKVSSLREQLLGALAQVD